MAKEKPSSKICKHCGTEIPYIAKVCPNCRRKVKGGKLKWVILIILALFILGAIFGSAGSDTTDQAANEKAENQVEEVSDDNDATEASEESTEANEEKTEAKIEYNKYECTELLDDLSNNALKAEKTHQDEYVTIHGYLATIDSDGSYVGIGAGEENYDYMFQEIMCYIKSDEQLDQIMEMNTNDEVTIKGKITSIGEVLGYSVDIIEIK